jgi:hypothetical protein
VGAAAQVGAGLGRPGTYAAGKPSPAGESLMAHAKGAYALSKQQAPKQAPRLKSMVVVPPKSGVNVVPQKKSGVKPVGTAPKTGSRLDPKTLADAVITTFTQQAVKAKSSTSGKPGVQPDRKSVV